MRACPPAVERHGQNEGTRAMTKHKTETREEWLAARLELLKAEKELTHRSDELARRRQELPWVRIEGLSIRDRRGGASLADLLRGARSCSSTTSCSCPTMRRGCPSEVAAQARAIG